MISFTPVNQEQDRFMAEHSDKCLYVRVVGIQGVKPDNRLRSRQPEFKANFRPRIHIPFLYWRGGPTTYL